MAKMFVEIGSADFDTCLPLAQSGWHGICVEPVPYLYKRIKDIYKDLPVHVMDYAISDTSGNLDMAVGRDDRDWIKGCSHIISDNHIGYQLSKHPDRINDFKETAQSDLQKKEGDLMKPLLEKVKASIQKVGKLKGYQYVLNATDLLRTDGPDLTADVKKDLGF